MATRAASAPAFGARTAGAAEEALRELRDDFDELLFVARAGRSRLAELASELTQLSTRTDPETAALLAAQTRLLHSRYGELARRLLGLKHHVAVANADELDELTAERARCAELLRTQQGVIAALGTAGDWQSPPFLSSTPLGSGGEYGRVTAHWNDYKRDRHLDADEYEAAYLRELFDAPGDWCALLTTCGMAALTTIVGYLLLDGCLSGPVVGGRALYHETKLVLERTLPQRVEFVDEADTQAFRRAIRELRPGAVFLDSLSNTKWAPLPDLAAVVDELRRLELRSYLVVDTTALAAPSQPLELVGADDARVRPLVFESLLKYHQLGLDRVNAGVVVARAADAERLSTYREHLGTNIGDVAARTLPLPSRAVLARRLARIERNAVLIADRLEASGSDVLAAVVHPALPSHPAYELARRLPFRGGCVSLVLDDPVREQAFVSEAVAEARRRGVRLVGGSSFGFDTTRTYLTAARASHGEPFVRICAGTEHRLDAVAVADALAAALVRLEPPR